MTQRSERTIGAAQAAVVRRVFKEYVTGHSPRAIAKALDAFLMRGGGRTVLIDGGAELLIWGDVVHAPPVQFARADCGFVLDVDMDLATTTRLRAMDMAAADRILIAGMHLDFPAFGHVRRGDGTECYRCVPMRWQAAF